MAESDPKKPREDVTPDPHADKPVPPPDPHLRDSADAAVVRPDEHEDLGPIPELFGAAGAEAHAFASDDPEVARAAIDRGAEAEGLETAQIFGLLLATIVVLIVVVLLVVVLVAWEGQTEDAQRQGQLTYPELTEVRNSEQQRLRGYGAVPGEDGVFHMPIDRAQALIAAEARQTDAGEGMVRQPDSRAGYNLAFPRLGAGGGIPAPWTLVDFDDEAEREDALEPEAEDEPGQDAESAEVQEDDQDAADSPPIE